MATPAGKVGITALAVASIYAGFLYLGVAIAIASFVFVMLLLPLYFGWNQPRQLAAAGFVALLVAAPLVSAGYAQELRTPVGAVSSPPSGNGSVLANAQVTPFTGNVGTTFDFQVTVHPEFLPKGAHGPEYLLVFLSTCFGAVSRNDSSCGGSYPFWELNHTFATTIVNATPVELTQKLNSSDLWSWNMAFVYRNASNVTEWVWIGGEESFSIQGPITGTYTDTYTLVLPTFYEVVFLYTGSVFFGALVIYLFIKSRQNRRNPPPMPGPSIPGGTGGPSGAGGSTPAAPRIERSCPKCGAVVYPEESACWKCGAPLGGTGAAPTPAALK
ncbi:MAG: zinc ribbon domain-containing protein [Thermoplasmata archaeon]|nr:zinc ribbon domain-containing protein [Thermoplasmata archaeon]